MAQVPKWVLLAGFVLVLQCFGFVDSFESHEEEKRFKTSPFTWSNPLSGYNIVLVRVPNHSPQEDKYQLQVIRGRSNPFSNKNSPAKMRQNYVLKWLGKYPYQTKG